MTSRKRNKGRDRKAKKAALEAEKVESERSEVRSVWHAWARGLDGSGGVITPCNHGSLTIPDKNYPVSCFIDTFFLNALNNMHTLHSIVDTFQRHTEVWKNESYRKMAIRILVHIGTNSFHYKGTSMPQEVTRAIVILENYRAGHVDSSIYNRVVATKLRDVHWSGSSVERDMLKFYRKRTTCLCLKKRHLEARKSQSKLGGCDHCGEEKERALLMVCSRCGIMQYCSRACQVANWRLHKEVCDLYVIRFQK